MDTAPQWVTHGLMLVAGLGAHLYIRQVKNPKVKQWTSTLFGLLCSVFLLGPWFFRHAMVLIVVNIAIINIWKKSYCYYLSYVYSFLHLSYYFLLKYRHLDTPGPLTENGIVFVGYVMKMIHLALEVHHVSNNEMNMSPEKRERLKVYTNLSVVDILHYCFSHVCVMSFFVRYRTYHDWIHHPLSQYAVRNHIQELKGTLFFVSFCIILQTIIEFFFKAKKLDFEVLQSLPPLSQFLYIEIIGLYIGSLMLGLWALGDIILITSGLGVYPVSTNPLAGQGPTTNLELLEEIYNDPVKARELEYNSYTIRNVFIHKIYTVTTMGQFWRYYNQHFHSFLKINVYSKFPIRRFKLWVTFMVSAYFHGGWLIYFIFWTNYVIYIESEYIWKDVVKKTLPKTSWKTADYVFLFSRILFLGQTFGATILIGIFSYVFKYFEVVYYIPLLYPLVMYILGSCVQFYINRKAGSLPHCLDSCVSK